MPAPLGMNCVLNYKDGGQAEAGSYTELTNCKDATLTLEAATADVTTRGNNGWRAEVATLKTGMVDFEMVWDVDDAGFTVIREAFLTNGVVAFQCLTEEGDGLQADFMITKFERSEGLEDAVTVSVSAKITYSETAPQWIEAA